MYAEVIKICGIGLICALTGAVIGKMVGGTAVAVRLAGLTLLFGVLMGMLDGAVGSLDGIVFEDGTQEYISLMLRGLGIATLCRICSDVCRDCGEPTVASGVESAGKIGMIVLAIPAVSDIVGQVYGLIDAL